VVSYGIAVRLADYAEWIDEEVEAEQTRRRALFDPPS
jgi:hypothetical protein